MRQSSDCRCASFGLVVWCVGLQAGHWVVRFKHGSKDSLQLALRMLTVLLVHAACTLLMSRKLPCAQLQSRLWKLKLEHCVMDGDGELALPIWASRFGLLVSRGLHLLLASSAELAGEGLIYASNTARAAGAAVQVRAQSAAALPPPRRQLPIPGHLIWPVRCACCLQSFTSLTPQAVLHGCRASPLVPLSEAQNAC